MTATAHVAASAVCAPTVQAWASTHAGAVRTSNEDRYLSRCDRKLWLVADGVGGQAHGDIAASAIVAAFERLATGEENLLANAERVLNETHARLRSAEGAAGATTVVVLVAQGGHVHCFWLGDSRAYRFRNGQLVLLTRDHSLLQELVEAGRIAPDRAKDHPARNVITRALGADCDILQIDRVSSAAQPGDLYLLCSDGLVGALDEPDIAAALSGAPHEVADAMVKAALVRGASDNVTALVIALDPAPR